nr:hypothetical protein Itr_chr01CG12250 [Ipomoea trifida]
MVIAQQRRCPLRGGSGQLSTVHDPKAERRMWICNVVFLGLAAYLRGSEVPRSEGYTEERKGKNRITLRWIVVLQVVATKLPPIYEKGCREQLNDDVTTHLICCGSDPEAPSLISPLTLRHDLITNYIGRSKLSDLIPLKPALNASKWFFNLFIVYKHFIGLLV